MKSQSVNAALLLAGLTQAQVKWNVDASHSKLGFSVTHLMVSETEGKFKIYQGSVESKSENDFTDSKIEFSADVASINTEDENRDGHLKSADFFDATKYPKITFKSISMKLKPKSKTAYTLTGDLTMHGVTKKITLLAIAATKPVKDPYGNIKYGFKVTGLINRKDFGLTWNIAIESGGLVVSEDVKLDLNIELIKSK